MVADNITFTLIILFNGSRQVYKVDNVYVQNVNTIIICATFGKGRDGAEK